MKLKDLLLVLSDELLDLIQVRLVTDVGNAMGLGPEVIYSGFLDERENLLGYLDYYVVCFEKNYIITIKGHKIA